MKKNLFTLALIMFFMINRITAQETETALAKIHYNFIHINDTMQRDKNHHDEMVLYLGQHSSFYSSYASKRLEEQLRKQVEAPGFDGNLHISGSGSGTPEAYYTVPSKKVLQLVYTLMGEHYLVDEEFPVLDWKIGEERKEIGGYNCQRAETFFKGRTYTAWFTTEIPFQAGPWKLQGLPGLILEASDQKNEVSFLYAGFEKMETGDMKVGIPDDAINTKREPLNKLAEAFRKNPVAAAKAHSQGGGGAKKSDPFSHIIDVSKIKSINVKREGAVKSPVTNNPMELEE